MQDFSNLVKIFIPTDAVTIDQFVTRLANLAALIAGIVAFFYLVYAGFMYLTAGGRPEQTQKALRAILDVIIGIVVISAAYNIVRFVTSAIAGFLSQ